MSTDPGSTATELAVPLQAALKQLATARSLLVCSDFDGTLAPIVPNPADARALPSGVSALLTLVGLPGTTVAVVSGRSRHDLAALAGLPPQVHLVGSHGAELGPGLTAAHGPAEGGPDAGGPDAGAGPDQDVPDSPSRRVAAIIDAVRDLTEGVPGVRLEPKPAGVAVHVRQVARKDAAAVLSGVRRGPASWAGVFSIEGHEVLELSVVEADKGRAVDVLREHSGADAVLFVGDDVTDERAFARLTGADVGVKVGAGPTAATYRVSDPTQVAALLTLLARERTSHTRR